MAIYAVTVTMSYEGMLEIDAPDEHSARSMVGQLETSLLDEIANWPTTELDALEMKCRITGAKMHP
jgi:hypothetical protein